jgi:hypothetical protein
MKKKLFLASFVAISSINNSNFCMEIEEADGLKQIISKKEANKYEQLKIILAEKHTAYFSGIPSKPQSYSTVPSALQYDLLKCCITNNNMVCLAACLTNDFNPNRYRKGPSLLHHAIECNNTPAIKLLAGANADLIPLEEDGLSPLDSAAILGYTECIDTLISVIKKKRDQLFKHKQHCGLTKHILKKGTCHHCIVLLTKQLTVYNIEDASYGAICRTYPKVFQ